MAKRIQAQIRSSLRVLQKSRVVLDSTSRHSHPMEDNITYIRPHWHEQSTRQPSRLSTGCCSVSAQSHDVPALKTPPNFPRDRKPPAVLGQVTHAGNYCLVGFDMPCGMHLIYFPKFKQFMNAGRCSPPHYFVLRATPGTTCDGRSHATLNIAG